MLFFKSVCTYDFSLSFCELVKGVGTELESIGAKDFLPHELEYQRKKVGFG